MRRIPKRLPRRPQKNLPKRSQIRRNNRGISLLELLVSVAIIAVAILPLLKAFTLSAKINAKSRVRLRATQVGKNMMEGYYNHSLSMGEVTGDNLDTLTTDPDIWDYSADTAVKFEKTEGVEYYVAANQMVEGKLYDVLIKADARAGGIYDAINNQEVIDLAPVDPTADAVTELVKDNDEVLAWINTDYPGLNLTAQDINRTITVDIGYSGTYMNVSVSYKYSFMDADHNIVTYPNEHSTDPKPYTDLMYCQEEQVDRQLKNIYLFYRPLYTTNYHGSFDTTRDRIVINADDALAHAINVFVVKQRTNETNLRVAENRYSVGVSVKSPIDFDRDRAMVQVRTNLGTNLDTKAATTQKQVFYKLNGTPIEDLSDYELTVGEVVPTAPKDRLYEVTVYVYESGSAANMFKNARPISVITGGMAD